MGVVCILRLCFFHHLLALLMQALYLHIYIYIYIYISKGGRLTLVKSMLASLPIYFMSLFQMSRSVCLRLEKIQRDFLWGYGALESKPHVVKWDIVCLDKRKGGLGVRCLHSLNKTLFCKWI